MKGWNRVWVLVATLAACSAPPPDDALPGDGGKSDDRHDAAADAGGGGVCTDECESGHVCDAGECSAVPLLRVIVDRATYQPPRAPTGRVQVVSYDVARAQPVDDREVLG